MNSSNRITFPIVIALLAVYFPWGGTYLAMKFAVETLPPFLLAGTRFVIAGAILYLWEVYKGTKTPDTLHWRNAAIIGGLMLLGGNSLVVWAEQTVSSGIAALIVATVPLWMTILAWIWQGNARPTIYVLLGLLLGFLGQVLLVSNSFHSSSYDSSQIYGYLVSMFASLSWAIGSLYSRKAQLPKSALMSIAIQNIMGGVLCLIVAISLGELGQLNIEQVSTRSLFSFAYLIFIGSIIGFSAYIWVLKATEPAIASTYAYVNPIVAVFLGWAFANEQLTSSTAIAALIILASVFLITRNAAPKKLPSPTTAAKNI
ncbi:EamA family transporter [Pelosinus propionicus]|uniref:Permease of the drug/metabolite transporter (DMT) superfamily n=1 Tax=Pelosinus propionicus DSM 13327 TaxID=1123291 RepID=A0A1I4JWR5_9FIRM|nr:EamA family transporter [Pelosinus propionicus]SFL71018.1 Permease of the drug/metabolite transporter (DMT) superfamily [Pelosinus propionicus DSM 13327]